jgi:hypothetical protein
LLNASVLSEDPATNLQLALGVELAVLPPYLYALWSVKSASDGASEAALEAANSIRAVVYEEMLHAGLVGNLLNAIGTRPQMLEHLVTYPGPLPGHTTEPPYAYEVGLGPLSPTTVATFLKIERPDWEPPVADSGWITIGDLYEEVKRQLAHLPVGAFKGGHQLPRGDNPGPGELIDVVDLEAALDAVETVIDQGEGHRPKPKEDPPAEHEDDDDHEVAHYYQFKTIAQYFSDGSISPERDLHPVIENPNDGAYTTDQQAANRRFNQAYTALLDSLQETFSSDAPRAFGPPVQLMRQLEHLAAVLRNTGVVRGGPALPGPTFEYLANHPGAG